MDKHCINKTIAEHYGPHCHNNDTDDTVNTLSLLEEHVNDKTVHLTGEDRAKLNSLSTSDCKFNPNKYYSKEDVDAKFLTKEQAGNTYLTHTEDPILPEILTVTVGDDTVEIGKTQIWLEMHDGLISLCSQTTPDTPQLTENPTVAIVPGIVEKGIDTTVLVGISTSGGGVKFDYVKLNDDESTRKENVSYVGYEVTANSATTYTFNYSINGVPGSKTVHLKEGNRYYYAVGPVYAERLFTERNSYLSETKQKESLALNQRPIYYAFFALPATDTDPVFSQNNCTGGWARIVSTFLKHGVTYNVWMTLEFGLGEINWKIS